MNIFVLDTKTGRIWQRFVESSGGPAEWEENRAPWVDESAVYTQSGIVVTQ